MNVNISPFRSETGFLSPGFLVDPAGDILLSGNLTITNQQFKINEIVILEIDNGELKLSSEIKNSSLTNLEVLEKLKVIGNTEIFDLQNNSNIEITNGKITITSTTKGNLDNVVIGQNIPVEGLFTDLTSSTALIDSITATTSTTTTASITTLSSNSSSIDNLTVSVALLDEATITDATINDATITELKSDNVTVNEQPTELFHATRKDYVDNRISALSIALGA